MKNQKTEERFKGKYISGSVAPTFITGKQINVSPRLHDFGIKKTVGVWGGSG